MRCIKTEQLYGQIIDFFVDNHANRITVLALYHLQLDILHFQKHPNKLSIEIHQL